MNLALTNIFADKKKIYLFHRIGKELCIMEDTNFSPYLYTLSDTGTYRGYFGKKYNKKEFKEYFQLCQARKNIDGEADVRLEKRILIDKINITKSEIRYIFFDIETESIALPDPTKAPDRITCITTHDNYTDDYKTFWILDYKTEFEMLNDFILYIKNLKPDLLIAFNGIEFDWTYLINRIPDFAKKISPINQSTYKTNFPAGISIIDYRDWIKKIYKYKRYSLEFVYTNTFSYKFNPQRYEFGELTEDIKEKNILDVIKMVELETKLNVIPYFDEIRRQSKSTWEELTMNSVIIDNMCLQMAKQKGLVLPSKPSEEEKLKREEDEIEGGFVLEPVKGISENIFLYDCSGTYPSIIRTFNLDPTNLRNEPNDNTVKIRNINVLQNENTIIPSLCNLMIQKRMEVQDALKNTLGEEYELLKKKDEALKSIANSIYGICLFKGSRLFNKNIAESITYLARLLIRYTKFYLRRHDCLVIGSDTDSVFCKTTKTKEEIEYLINNDVINNYLKHFGKDKGYIKFKYEGYYKSLYIEAKKHYIGYFVKPNGEEKKVIKGLSIIRSDSGKFQEQFVEDYFTMILDGKSEKEIVEWIKLEKERMKTLPLTDISFPVRLSKSLENYKTEGIHLRALKYAKDVVPDWQINVGQSFFYTFVKPFGVEETKGERTVKGVKKEVINKKNKDVMAFDEFSEHIKNYEIDYNKLIERNIMMKIKNSFNALGWNLDEVK